MLTPKQFTFDITAPAELAAGRRGFEDRITVIVDSGDPGGDGDEFAVYLRQALAEWFDAYVALNENAPSVRLQAEWDALAADRDALTKLTSDLLAENAGLRDIIDGWGDKADRLAAELAALKGE